MILDYKKIVKKIINMVYFNSLFQIHLHLLILAYVLPNNVPLMILIIQFKKLKNGLFQLPNI